MIFVLKQVVIIKEVTYVLMIIEFTQVTNLKFEQWFVVMENLELSFDLIREVHFI